MRVEARGFDQAQKLLRERGNDDQVIIELPTGAYVPTFALICLLKRTRAPETLPRTALDRRAAILESQRGTGYGIFSDGLTEELIHGLTKLDGLRVMAWTSAARLKGQEYDVREIGRQLKVSTILMGSVRGSCERLRIMAQLVDTSAGSICGRKPTIGGWRICSRSRKRSRRPSLKPCGLSLWTTRPRRRRPSARNLEAYNLFLKGRLPLEQADSGWAQPGA